MNGNLKYSSCFSVPMFLSKLNVIFPFYSPPFVAWVLAIYALIVAACLSLVFSYLNAADIGYFHLLNCSSGHSFCVDLIK